MRSSDWSSDVCSSDLRPPPRGRPVSRLHRHFAQQGLLSQRALLCRPQRAETDHRLVLERRSEEHTSELQSLMRISYAVFCFKKNNHTFRFATLCQSHINHYTY